MSVNHFEPESKNPYHGSIHTRMSRRNSSLLGSVCWQYLWNPWETVLEHYVERCSTVISERYSDILRHNRLANQRKRDGFLLVRGVILEHDNKHLHSAVKSIGTLQDPSYRTDPTDRIAPSFFSSPATFLRSIATTTIIFGEKNKMRWRIRCICGISKCPNPYFLKASGIFCIAEISVYRRPSDYVEKWYLIFMLCLNEMNMIWNKDAINFRLTLFLLA